MNFSPTDIENARRGDETAQAAVITHMMPAIRMLARRNTTRSLEWEDAVQEGLIALFHAIDTFDSRQQTQFSTYAMVCIRNGITDARIRAQRKKHQPLNSSVPLDENQPTPGPEEQALSNEEYHTTVKKIRTNLSATERAVLLMYLNGMDYHTIAVHLGSNDKAVGNALTRVRNKLKSGE